MNCPQIKLPTPQYWEPGEALAVWELLTELTDLICSTQTTRFHSEH